MAKKVVDADILIEQLSRMQGRSWVNSSYYNGGGYGGNSIEDAMRNAGQMIASQVNANVTTAMNMMLMELRNAIMVAQRDEDGGLCGLCRVVPDEALPTDYRPGITSR